MYYTCLPKIYDYDVLTYTGRTYEHKHSTFEHTQHSFRTILFRKGLQWEKSGVTVMGHLNRYLASFSHNRYAKLATSFGKKSERGS
ncbi:Uncharacterized protein APZ42_034539 [Daphnia magna]|uniref:Uncharacterized protein n=1 Tax=Daphnia magna TaxID=35525 RepID=A0A164K2E6_9CRUS|nr:Uncharacterized protein APZ42_034539 [Daphnia magna]